MKKVLDIGCGWGGMAFEIARQTQCEVTGISLSENQIKYCREKAKELNLDNQVRFELIDYRVIVESKSSLIEDTLTEATVKLRIGSEIRHTASVGNGPVNAIDLALRKALLQDFPTLDSVRLTDYKVRVIDQGSGTEAFVRVLIDSTDGNRSWQTMGASTNIIEASWIAVVDSLEYWNLHFNK